MSLIDPELSSLRDIEPNLAALTGPKCRACLEPILNAESAIDGYCPFCYKHLIETTSKFAQQQKKHPELLAKDEYQVIDISRLL